MPRQYEGILPLYDGEGYYLMPMRTFKIRGVRFMMEQIVSDWSGRRIYRYDYKHCLRVTREELEAVRSFCDGSLRPHRNQRNTQCESSFYYTIFIQKKVGEDKWLPKWNYQRFRHGRIQRSSICGVSRIATPTSGMTRGRRVHYIKYIESSSETFYRLRTSSVTYAVFKVFQESVGSEEFRQCIRRRNKASNRFAIVLPEAIFNHLRSNTERPYYYFYGLSCKIPINSRWMWNPVDDEDYALFLERIKK